MKALYTGLMVASLVVITGCNTSTTGGKPGEPKGAFRLKGPANLTDIEVKRKTPKPEKITVDAEKNFKEEITFTTKVDPADQAKHLKVEVKPSTWKPSDPKEVEVIIEAGDEAPKGEYTIHVTGKPAKGDPTTVDLKIKVPEKK
jgi:hypothetical protein